MCMCALWGLSSAVYKCLLITTFNFKARAHRTSRGRETVVSAILNIVADTRTETGTHSHTHTRTHTHSHTSLAVAPIQECVLWVWVWAALFAQRSPPRPVNLFAAQPGLGRAENSCAVHSCPNMCVQHPTAQYSPLTPSLFHGNLSSTLWRLCA